ncbi:hypothetical protein JTE90_010867 [Oedothorax gibbosus]|uniref:Reelin domain-containing protein n=1 Tax=Oedothorax gibbosus TaxID=931172 RepID=A0AAV6V309_9ARAC|nr:hypothetical protein JTE90_010867 [Oedothorax gibbosus]
MLLVGVVGAWPSGAPSKACDSLMPQHGANRPQSARSAPYTLVQSTDSYRPGDQVIVYVRGSVPFKGLLIQAFDPRTNATLGEWVEGGGLKQLAECAAMSHADNRDKKAATLVWRAPTQHGNVRFRGTVVQQFNTFYHGLSATVQKV